MSVPYASTVRSTVCIEYERVPYLWSGYLPKLCLFQNGPLESRYQALQYMQGDDYCMLVYNEFDNLIIVG